VGAKNGTVKKSLVRNTPVQTVVIVRYLALARMSVDVSNQTANLNLVKRASHQHAHHVKSLRHLKINVVVKRSIVLITVQDPHLQHVANVKKLPQIGIPVDVIS